MSEWNLAICETNQINIHYVRTGGNKPPLILLHGLTANGACWTSVAQSLEGEYDVIMPDARGHGKSSAPIDGYRYEDHVNDIEGLIHSLRLSHPIVIGHSMGGMTAAFLASRKSRLLRGLGLVDPTFLNPQVQREVYESDAAEQHRRLLSESPEETLAEARTKHPQRSLETLKLIAEARHQTSISAFQVLMPPNPEYKQLVSAIDVPSLLVIAEKGVVSQAVAEELRGLSPRLYVEKIMGAGHGVHYDQPEQFADVIQSFLRAI